MIDMERAYEILFANIAPVPTVGLPLGQALHRTLAEAIRCDVDCPSFDRSMMDGYAVRSADVADTPVVLRITGQVAAGAIPERSLSAGEAMQINTGAPMPKGADAVARVEITKEVPEKKQVRIDESVPAGRFITRRRTYATAGETVLQAGTMLTPINIATAATAGAARVTVYRPARVAVLSTGYELIEIDRFPEGAQVRNSNQYLVESLLQDAHVEPVLLGAVDDDRDALRVKIEEGLTQDVLCTTGGISMGAFDFVPDVLQACGAEFLIHKLAIKPGRPTIVAKHPHGALVFALPGNPTSTWVGFELLVRPALAALEGRVGERPPLVQATLHGTIRAAGNRRSYIPARAGVDDDGRWQVAPLAWRGSGDSLGSATANALIMRPPGAQEAGTGEEVWAVLLDRR